MFRNRIFYDNLTDSITETWKLYVFLGTSLIVFGFLIFIFPQFLAYLVAFFLVWSGAILVNIGLKTKKLRGQYRNWVNDYWEATQEM
jgi:uncharacterized membrane protein HdeD (DUF308 family)